MLSRIPKELQKDLNLKKMQMSIENKDSIFPNILDAKMKC